MLIIYQMAIASFVYANNLLNWQLQVLFVLIIYQIGQLQVLFVLIIY